MLVWVTQLEFMFYTIGCKSQWLLSMRWSEGLVVVVAAMMNDDDLHCHCGWRCWWCWWWWRWFADGEDNHHWCRPPKRTLHSFTAGTLLPPTSQLQMTSKPRNVLLGYITSNWITNKLELSFIRLNIHAERLLFYHLNPCGFSAYTKNG